MLFESVRQQGYDAGYEDFNRLARKNSSECGAAVEWVDAGAATAHGMPY